MAYRINGTLPDSTRMSIQEKQLSRRLNILRGKLEVLQKNHRCDLPKAISIFKEMHKRAGVTMSEELLLDLKQLESEHREAV